jgi:hypothetical protein
LSVLRDGRSLPCQHAKPSADFTFLQWRNIRLLNGLQVDECITLVNTLTDHTSYANTVPTLITTTDSANPTNRTVHFTRIGMNKTSMTSIRYVG